MADSTPRASRGRRWLLFVGGALLGLLIVVALLPTLVSAGLGQGWIRGAIDRRINGTVAIDQMRFRWLGGQTIRGLRIADADGNQVTDVDVHLDSTLLGILFRQPGPLDVTLSGTIRGEIRPDGSLNLAELGATGAPAPTQPRRAEPASDEPFHLPELPEITLRPSKLDVLLRDQESQQELALQDLNGQFSFVTHDRPISISLSAATRHGDKAGRIEIKGLANDLFDYAGRLKLREALVELDVSAEGLAVPLTVSRAIGVDEALKVQTLTMSLASDDLTQDIVASLSAQVQSDRWSRPGHVEAQLAASKLLGNRGHISPQGGSIHASMTMRDVPLPAPELDATIRELSATIASSDLARGVQIGVDGTTQVQNFEPSPLMARITMNEPFTAQGAFEFSLAKLTGSASGQAVPATIIQPLLATTPIIATRDIGATVDGQATFSPGEAKDISLVASGAYARLELTATVNPHTRAISGSNLLVASSAVQPDLLRELTGAALTCDAPFDIELRLSSFTYPAADDAAPLPNTSVEGSIELIGPATIAIAAAPAAAGGDDEADSARSFEVKNLRARFNAAPLGRQLDAAGSLSVDGALVTFDERIVRLFDAGGRLTPAQAIPQGSLRIQGLAAATIASLAPQQRTLIDAAVGRAMDAAINTDDAGGNLRVSLSATGAAFEAEITAVRLPDALQMEGGQIKARLTPALARALQPEAVDPIVPKSAANITVDLQPALFPAKAEGGYGLPAQEPLRAVVNVASAEFEKLPGLTQPLSISDVIAELQMMREGDGMALIAAGDAELRSGSDRGLLTRARYSAKVVQRDERAALLGDVALVDLSVAELERALGTPAGAWSQWTGVSGRVQAHLEASSDTSAWTARVRSDLPHLSGEFAAQRDSRMISITASDGALTLRREVLERRMNPDPQAQPSAGAANDAPARVSVQSDLPLTFTIEQLQVPVGGSEATDVAGAQMRIRAASTQPLQLVNPDGTRTSLDQLTVAVDSASLREGVAFEVVGRAHGEGPSAPAATGQSSTAPAQRPPATAPSAGTLNITGRMTNLVNEASAIDPADARLELNAKFQDVPTAVVDAMANLQGLLVAAVGGPMNATITANNLSMNTGRMDVDVRTPNGFLTTQIRGREGTLRIPPDPPLTAELNVTPQLRERLLYRLHPLLADIRTTKQPLRATIASGVVPLGPEGSDQAVDLSGLRADVEITVGEVEFESGSTTLALLRLFNEADRRTIPGSIEPISAKIRNGVIRYDQFAVRIDKYTLRYSGEIDLVKQAVNLRTELPLEALATTFQELEGYADRIVVPLVTRGSFGALKTEIDPKFDVGKAALDAGLGGALDDILNRRGSSISDLLDQLNKPKPRRPR